ncbi:MAG: hypothetical protein M3388_09570 [Acidobacteriota bacterium]|nr:hypothetical protein [Acidobacteriota bacterium]
MVNEVLSKSENGRNKLIDNLLRNLTKNFHSFLLAKTLLQFGETNFQYINENAVIQVVLSKDDSIEPIPIYELVEYKDFFPTFLVEVFHDKAVILWQEFLTNIFSLYVDLHFDGKRKFEELKTRQIHFDFKCEDDVICHIKERLINGFAFENYKDRIRIISKICEPQESSANCETTLYEIYKNVIIRNSLQHKDGILTKDSVNLLGRETIEVLDAEGNNLLLNVGDKINLSLQEFYRFNQSLIFIGQLWRK